MPLARSHRRIACPRSPRRGCGRPAQRRLTRHYSHALPGDAAPDRLRGPTGVLCCPRSRRRGCGRPEQRRRTIRCQYVLRGGATPCRRPGRAGFWNLGNHQTNDPLHWQRCSPSGANRPSATHVGRLLVHVTYVFTPRLPPAHPLRPPTPAPPSTRPPERRPTDRATRHPRAFRCRASRVRIRTRIAPRKLAS